MYCCGHAWSMWIHRGIYCCAKSGPMQLPCGVITIAKACCRKLGLISTVFSTGCSWREAKNPPASPAQKAGRYSLRALVAHSPASVTPMLAPCGTSRATCQRRSSGTILLKLSNSKPVGFLLFAPHRPCETSKKYIYICIPIYIHIYIYTHIVSGDTYFHRIPITRLVSAVSDSVRGLPWPRGWTWKTWGARRGAGAVWFHSLRWNILAFYRQVKHWTKWAINGPHFFIAMLVRSSLVVLENATSKSTDTTNGTDGKIDGQ